MLSSFKFHSKYYTMPLLNEYNYIIILHLLNKLNYPKLCNMFRLKEILHQSQMSIHFLL